MGSHRSPRTAIAVLVCALALTGCSRYDDNVVLENGLEVPVVFAVQERPEPSLKETAPEAFEMATDPGDNTSRPVSWPAPDPPWHIWPLSEFKDPPCREDLSLVAYTEDERTIVRDGAVCPADFWTVTD